MHGFKFTMFLTTVLLSSATFATDLNHNDPTMATLLNTKMGCMSCHQGGPMQANIPTKKIAHHKPHAQTASAN